MGGVLTAAIAAAFSGVTADPYYEYTTLLLPGNGTNGAQNNTFLDGSTNNFTITRNGNTTQGTFSPFSQTGWGNYFNGSSWLATSSSPATLSGNFTFECWVYITSYAAPRVMATLGDAFSATGVELYVATSGRLGMFGGNAAIITGTTQSVSLNTWTHVAFVRSSNTIKLYVNGAEDATTASNSTSFTGIAQIGRELYNGLSGNFFLGYISNLRINTTAVYPGAFTPSTTPLTAISGTALLTCQSNRFVDNSSNAFAITPNGSPTVVAFSPFNPTASWSAATNGGSGYFDGTGDYLSNGSAPVANFGTNDFTFEFWVYFTAMASASYYQIFSSTASIGGFQVYKNASSNNLVWDINGTSTDLILTGLVSNQWYHIAVARSGTNLRTFANGVLTYTYTNSTNFTITGAYIGSYPTGASYFPGYISGLRVVKGTAVYTSNFTPPTAPPTAITNTSLLLNFTNAGIYDATSKNDLETVGNAQISTTQSKWGGSSISFDGTGDWLLIPDQPPQRIGTGNFTVEMWVYRNSSGTYGLVGKGTGTTGWLVSLNSSNQVVFTYGSSTITSSGTVSDTTWTHIAVVREGTSTNQTKIYINGTNDGTGTVSTDFNQTNSMYIGADRTGGSAANAYVQDVRITNYARYTGNFTAPTAAFPTL